MTSFTKQLWHPTEAGVFGETQGKRAWLIEYRFFSGEE